MRSLLLALLLVALAAATAFAHLGSKKVLRVERRAAGPRIVAELEAVDAAVELGLGEDYELPGLLARSAQVRLWVEENLILRAGEAPCEPSVAEPEPFEREGKELLRVVVDYRCSAEDDLHLEDGLVFGADPRHESVVLTRVGEEAHILRRGRQTLALGEPQGALELFGIFLWEGVLHFATGYDHVLFLLSLVLAAGFLARRESTRAALKHVAWLVTAFTVGHSITLISAALEVVVLPIQPVEVAIAASIVAVAGWNVVKPEVRAPMPWIAFAFGLIHGFGFSAVLAEVGLPAGHRVVALVAFNVGIELAQLLFVAVVLGPIAWLARSERYPLVVRGVSVLIAALALFWVVDRL